MNDLVSVCVPTYNGERYLRESLECVVSQTHQNLEILIVDDQSKDGTIAISKEFQEKDPRVKLIQNKKNLGLVGNWNKCIEEASGEWIKLHFQDDVMVAETVEEMLKAAHEFDVKFVLADRKYIFEGKRKNHFDNLRRLSDHYNETTVLEAGELGTLLNKIGIDHNFMGEPILGLIGKDLFKTYGNYDEHLMQIVDLEYWLRLGLNTRFVFMPKHLHTFRVHGESQGAKNGKKKGINPTHLDRINILWKFLKEPVYDNYRKANGAEYSSMLLAYYVKKYVFMYGYKHMKQVLEDEVMSHFEKNTWNNLLGNFGDLKSSLKYGKNSISLFLFCQFII